MVDESRLEEWVEEKLDEGVSEDRLKKILREKDHDPSIVDEVSSPFDGGVEEDDLEADSEEDTDGDSSEIQEEASGRSWRSVLPGFSALKWPFFLFVLLGVGVAGYMFLPGAVDLDLQELGVELQDIRSSAEDSIGKLSSEDCQEIGVRLSDIRTEDGETVADVLVDRGETEVVLEVYENGDLVDFSEATVGGESWMKVSSTGDKAVFRPVGCSRPRDSSSIG